VRSGTLAKVFDISRTRLTTVEQKPDRAASAIAARHVRANAADVNRRGS
jgi:hypothetical protein